MTAPRGHRHGSRKDYDMSVRVSLLEDDADSFEQEMKALKQSIQRLTYSITGATLSLVVGLIMWAVNIGLGSG